MLKRFCMRSFLIALLVGLLGLSAQAQWSFSASGGLCTSAPIVTKNIPAGASVTPQLGDYFGLDVNYGDWSGFSVGIGLTQSLKRAETNSPIRGEINILRDSFGIDLGSWTDMNFVGTASSSFHSRYLAFPVYIKYKPGKHWSGLLGLSYQCLLSGSLKGRADIKTLYITSKGQAFDQSQDLAPSGKSLLLGGGYSIKNWGLVLRIDWDLYDLYDASAYGLENPRNVALNLFIQYSFYNN